MKSYFIILLFCSFWNRVLTIPTFPGYWLLLLFFFKKISFCNFIYFYYLELKDSVPNQLEDDLVMFYLLIRLMIQYVDFICLLFVFFSVLFYFSVFRLFWKIKTKKGSGSLRNVLNSVNKTKGATILFKIGLV